MTSFAPGRASRAARILAPLVRMVRARLTSIAMVACILACGILPVVLAGGRSLWLDEAWVANSATAPSLHEVFYYDAWLQTSPPLFLLLVRAAAAVFGLSNWTLRATPLAMELLAAAAMAILAWRLLPGRFAILAWALFVLSPTGNTFGATLKQYSAECAAATLVLLVAIAYWRHPGIRRFRWLVAAVVVALFLAYSTAFLLPGVFLLVWFAPARDGRLRPYQRALALGAAAGATLAVEYVLLIAPNTSPVLRAYWQNDSQGKGFTEAMFGSGVELLKLLPAPERLLAHRYLVDLPVAALLAAGIVLACLRYSRGRRQWLAVQMLCGIPCLLLVLCDWFGWYPLSARTSLFALPLVVLLLVSSLYLASIFLFARWRRAWARWLLDLMLVGVALAAVAAGIYRHPFSRLRLPDEDAQAAIHYLRDHVRPGDLLWVHASAAEDFKLYRRMLGWNPAPARFGHTGSPCCPRGLPLMKGSGSELAVRRDLDMGIPAATAGAVWLLSTARDGHWEFIGLDEWQAARQVLAKRGCTELPTPRFHNMAIGAFQCRGGG